MTRRRKPEPVTWQEAHDAWSDDRARPAWMPGWVENTLAVASVIVAHARTLGRKPPCP